ncbi:MAG: type II toxin-antitoxin system Phd/YefM family antitoxin [Enterobacterales bacterium]|nr:type II toxin-antitoxin system Phd/YefM family antitoxin [Enterobacterales bacterium]
MKSVLDRALEDIDFTIISRRDADDAVVMSLDSFNGFMEPLHLLKSSANSAHLAKSNSAIPLWRSRKS